MAVRLDGDSALASDKTSASFKESGPSTGSKGRSDIKLGYIVTPIAPSSYSKLTYLPPFTEAGGGTFSEAQSASSLWQKSGSSSLSLLGLGFEFEYAFSQAMSLTTGLRYRFYKDFLAKTDYNMTDPLQYLEISQKASALGLYFDFQFLNLELGPTTFLSMSSGLDYDMATMVFTATHKVDGGGTGALGELYKASSKVSTVSLRLGSALNLLFLDPLGLYMAVNLLVPLSGSSGDPSLTINDPYQTKVANAKEDFKESLAHKKNSFGAEVFLGGLIAF